MSQIDRSVTNHDVIPVISSEVFAAAPGARLAAGVIAVDGVPLPGFEEAFAAHFQLRTRVYVDQTGQLAESDLQADGTDRDADDDRSVTFSVFENLADGARIIGVCRLIVRGDARPLPVESFCPDSFVDAAPDASSVEVSRVIARHERAAMQGLVQWHLFAMMLAYIDHHRISRTFAILEPWLERHVRSMISIERIGEVQYVEHYLDLNVPIEVDVPASIAMFAEREPDLIPNYQATEPALSFFGRVRPAPAAATAAAEDPAAGGASAGGAGDAPAAIEGAVA